MSLAAGRRRGESSPVGLVEVAADGIAAAAAMQSGRISSRNLSGLHGRGGYLLPQNITAPSNNG